MERRSDSRRATLVNIGKFDLQPSRGRTGGASDPDRRSAMSIVTILIIIILVLLAIYLFRRVF